MLARLFVLAVLGGVIPVTSGIAWGQGLAVTPPSTVDASATLVDSPIEPYRLELLDLAYQSVSAMPLQPHIRNRSRGQEAVVEACFALDQPQRALRYAEGIADWRRGSGFAEFALYCAQHGHTDDVQRHLDLAAQIAHGEEDWRRDVVLIKIAKAYEVLGKASLAAALEADVVDSEAGKVDVIRAGRSADAQFDEQFTALDATLASANFDRMRNALDACTVLLDRYYGDEARRERIASKIRSASMTLAPYIRVDFLIAIAETATRHNDKPQALQAVKEAQYIVDHLGWLPEDRIAMTARLARVRFNAGEGPDARKMADAAYALYTTERAQIQSMDRASALRPIAEAYSVMGDNTAAMAVYKQTVAEGAVNPNARPRAVDLSATCLSLARFSVEPDAELWATLRQTCAGLVDPW